MKSIEEQFVEMTSPGQLPMTENELLPCPVPWCGADDARRYEGDATYAPRVQCPKCRLTASAGTLSAAIAKWNTRPSQSPDLRATQEGDSGVIDLRDPEVEKLLDDLDQAISEGAGHLALESARIIRLLREEHRRLFWSEHEASTALARAALSAPQSSVRADNRERIAGEPWDAGQIKDGKAQRP